MRATTSESVGLPPGLVEDMNKRTRHAKIFIVTDRKRISILSNDLHYEDRPGEWEPQVYGFLLRGGNHVAERHWFNTRVSDLGIDVVDKQTGVGVRWLIPRPTISSQCARLNRDGVAWEWIVGPRRLKLQGTVTAPLGRKTYSFPYTPLGSSQDFSIINEEAVAPGIHVSRPVIIGANRQSYQTSGWRVAPGKLEFTFDDRVLPPEAYPYIIDPTTTFQPGSSGFDSTMYSAAADTNSGSSNNHQVGDDSTAPVAGRMILKFDVSSISSGDTVSATTLSLWEIGANDSGGVGPWNAELRKVRRDWVESEVTWNSWETSNTWSTAGASNTSTDRYSAVSATLSVDGTTESPEAFVAWTDAVLTQDAQDFVDGSKSNYGWILSSESIESNASNDTWTQYRTSDYSTSSKRPKWAITHETPFQRRSPSGGVAYSGGGVAIY
jgi:hypothetical protein